jgi:2-dehydropantoate 2-reductase
VKFLIAGAGAVGAYIGALIARSGQDVTLFARGAHLRAMQERGVTVESPAGNFVVRPKVIPALEESGPTDVIILGVKAHSLPELAPLLKPLLGPETVVVSTQNGLPWWFFESLGGTGAAFRSDRLDPGGAISAAIEFRRVLGSIVYLSTELVEPGVVRHIEGDRLTLGEPRGGRSDRCRCIADALSAPGLRCQVTAHLREEIWLKLAGSAALNPISVLTGATIGEMLGDAEMRALVRTAMAESEEVARALGIELPIDIDRRLAGAEKVGAHKTSMLQDFEAGRPMELEPILGIVIELGDRFGLTLPCLRTLYACTRMLVSRRSRIERRN